ncbi:MAG TPA: DNA-3-methyladenine glycosylase [Thermoanaerobaculia bacterium]|nr:DNA-3-methyladenine glycosylase [Thermoanaerobaculia bacterium]
MPSTTSRSKNARLGRDFYLGETVDIARALLGCTLWREVGGEKLAARIVETEAYLGANDPASHTRRGLRTPRNESMYLPGGHAYVYFTYGMYHCVNVVTQERDVAEAVLIRAAQPLRGHDRMQRNRPNARREFDLLNGPGKLCMAMEIDRDLNGAPLDGKTLYLTSREAPVPEEDIATSPRIGIDGAGEAAHWPLRFFLVGNRYVSMYKRGS